MHSSPQRNDVDFAFSETAQTKQPRFGGTQKLLLTESAVSKF